jgi:ubiquinone/menaquinone biosynthesis C-methylase UbiE
VKLQAIESDKGYQAFCSGCDATYPALGGIINFGVADAFYDEHGFTSTGRDFSDSSVEKLGLYFARSHFLYEISCAVPPGSAVIEIGPGGGSRYLAKRYDMLGVELSAASVRCAAVTYSSAVQATVETLPVADGCADAVVSSFLLEHLGPGIIERSISEMARVLKPGGQMLHFFDVDTDGPFVGWAKRQRWYANVFIASKGHYGMRTLTEWQGLFTEAGFALETQRLSCKSWLQDLSVWGALDQPEVQGVPRRLGHAAAVVRQKLNPVADLAVNALNDLVDRLLPDPWAAKAILVLRKIG